MKKQMNLKRTVIILIIIILVLFGGYYLAKKLDSPVVEKQEEVVVKKKTVEVINFETWKPDNYRKILGTVKSSSDISIYSNLSGNIEEVFVEIGDEVKEGEVIAKFSRENDISQISYENALRSLENSKISAENSVQSSEIALENARNDLKQAISLTEQNHSQIFKVLLSQSKSAETTISNSLNWADRILGVSREFKYEVDPTRSSIGKNNFILKNDTKNSLEQTLRIVENSRDLKEYELNDEDKIIYFAVEKKNILKDTQTIVRNLDKLIRGTTAGNNFSQVYRNQLQQEVEGISAKIDGSIVSLESQIEAAKSGEEQINSSILSAENRVKNAESTLILAKSSADNQVSSLYNQINLAKKSLNDLNVKAPFSGVISSKLINNYERVNPGQKLFSIVSKDSVPEVISYLSAEETDFLNNLDNIKIELSNGETIPIENVAIAGKLDSATQKMEVKFRGISDKLLIGSIANIILPINSENSNLIPISAVSFEPDGAEVFVVNYAKKVERRKIQTGKIISSAVEVLGGLESGEILVKYRNRVNAGDEVQLKVNN